MSGGERATCFSSVFLSPSVRGFSQVRYLEWR